MRALQVMQVMRAMRVMQVMQVMRAMRVMQVMQVMRAMRVMQVMRVMRVEPHGTIPFRRWHNECNPRRSRAAHRSVRRDWKSACSESVRG